MHTLELKILAASAVLLWTGIGNGADRGPGLMDIKEAVRQIYVHGVPYKEASRYDASEVPTLLKMLNAPKERDYWSNIVAVLGIIGDERALEPMLEFIEKGKEGTPTRSRYKANKSALMSLGYLINKTGNQRALDYLIRSMTPWISNPDKNLGKYAVLGLGLSGHPKAAEALKAALTRAPRSEVKEIISEALRTNKEVAEKGLAGYYRTSRRP